MKKFFGEFKEFISRGNVLDMAVGVVVGAAFKAIIDSLVNNIIMPVVKFMLGDLDFSTLSIVLREAVLDLDGKTVLKEAVSLDFGLFINAILSFIIIAFCLFCVVKVANKLRRKKEEAPAPDPEPSAEEKLLTEIRDLLKEKNN